MSFPVAKPRSPLAVLNSKTAADAFERRAANHKNIYPEMANLIRDPIKIRSLTYLDTGAGAVIRNAVKEDGEFLIKMTYAISRACQVSNEASASHQATKFEDYSKALTCDLVDVAIKDTTDKRTVVTVAIKPAQYPKQFYIILGWALGLLEKTGVQFMIVKSGTTARTLLKLSVFAALDYGGFFANFVRTPIKELQEMNPYRMSLLSLQRAFAQDLYFTAYATTTALNNLQGWKHTFNQVTNHFYLGDPWMTTNRVNYAPSAGNDPLDADWKPLFKFNAEKRFQDCVGHFRSMKLDDSRVKDREYGTYDFNADGGPPVQTLEDPEDAFMYIELSQDVNKHTRAIIPIINMGAEQMPWPKHWTPLVELKHSSKVPMRMIMAESKESLDRVVVAGARASSLNNPEAYAAAAYLGGMKIINTVEQRKMNRMECIKLEMHLARVYACLFGVTTLFVNALCEKYEVARQLAKRVVFESVNSFANMSIGGPAAYKKIVIMNNTSDLFSIVVSERASFIELLVLLFHRWKDMSCPASYKQSMATVSESALPAIALSSRLEPVEDTGSRADLSGDGSTERVRSSESQAHLNSLKKLIAEGYAKAGLFMPSSLMSTIDTLEFETQEFEEPSTSDSLVYKYNSDLINNEPSVKAKLQAVQDHMGRAKAQFQHLDAGKRLQEEIDELVMVEETEKLKTSALMAAPGQPEVIATKLNEYGKRSLEGLEYKKLVDELVEASRKNMHNTSPDLIKPVVYQNRKVQERLRVVDKWEAVVHCWDFNPNTVANYEVIFSNLMAGDDGEENKVKAPLSEPTEIQSTVALGYDQARNLNKFWRSKQTGYCFEPSKYIQEYHEGLWIPPPFTGTSISQYDGNIAALPLNAGPSAFYTMGRYYYTAMTCAVAMEYLILQAAYLVYMMEGENKLRAERPVFLGAFPAPRSGRRKMKMKKGGSTPIPNAFYITRELCATHKNYTDLVNQLALIPNVKNVSLIPLTTVLMYFTPETKLLYEKQTKDKTNKEFDVGFHYTEDVNMAMYKFREFTTDQLTTLNEKAGDPGTIKFYYYKGLLKKAKYAAKKRIGEEYTRIENKILRNDTHKFQDNVRNKANPRTYDSYDEISQGNNKFARNFANMNAPAGRVY